MLRYTIQQTAFRFVTGASHSRARLPAKAEDGGRFRARRLAAAYDRFQSRFPENAQVKVTEDGWRLSSDVAERRSPEEQPPLAPSV